MATEDFADYREGAVHVGGKTMTHKWPMPVTMTRRDHGQPVSERTVLLDTELQKVD